MRIGDLMTSAGQRLKLASKDLKGCIYPYDRFILASWVARVKADGLTGVWISEP